MPPTPPTYLVVRRRRQQIVSEVKLGALEPPRLGHQAARRWGGVRRPVAAVKPLDAAEVGHRLPERPNLGN